MATSAYLERASEPHGQAPILLVEICLTGKTLYLTNFNASIRINNNEYLPLIETVSSVREEINFEEGDSFAKNCEVSAHNLMGSHPDYLDDPEHSFSELLDSYKFATKQIKIYNWFMGTAYSDKEPFFIGVINDQKEDIETVTLFCEDSLRTVDAIEIGTVIEKSSYPSADPDDLGKILPEVLGNVAKVPARAIDAGGYDYITDEISATSPGSGGAITLSDASEFPSSGAFTIQIDNEQIRISSRSGNNLTVQSRGYNSTTAVAHEQGTVAFEVQGSYTYYCARHGVSSLGDVYVDDVRQTGGLTKYQDAPARIVLNSRVIWENKVILENDDQIIVNDAIGVSDTIGVNDGIAVSDDINITQQGSVNVTVLPNGGPANVRDGSLDTYVTVNAGSRIFMDYPSASSGTIVRQYHKIHVWSYYEQTIQINANPITLPAGVKTTVYAVSTGTGWSEQTDILNQSGNPGSIRVYEAWKDVEYRPQLTKTGSAKKSGTASKVGSAAKTGQAYKTGTVTLKGNSSANTEIGEDVRVDIIGLASDRNISNACKAVYETILARTDYNAVQFAAFLTRTSNKLFDHAILEKIDFSTLRREMSFQSGSVIYFDYNNTLSVVWPDANASPVIGLDITDERSIRYKSPMDKIKNRVRVLYNYDLTQKEEGATDGFLGSTSWVEDSASQAEYGIKELDIQANWIRDSDTAVWLRDLWVSWLKIQRWTIEIEIENYAISHLKIGDAFTVTFQKFGWSLKKFWMVGKETDPANIKIILKGIEL